MPITYSNADYSTIELVDSVLAEHFSVIDALKPRLRIDVKMGRDPKALVGCKVHGHPCVAAIKIVKAEERSTWDRDHSPADFPDLRLFIDSHRWQDFSDRQKEVALFHELNHIVPVRDKKTGQTKIDEYGRIKLKLRLDDWMLTGFVATVEVFGEDALEYQALVGVRKKLSQMVLKFGKDSPKAKPAAAPSLLVESVSEEVA